MQSIPIAKTSAFINLDTCFAHWTCMFIWNLRVEKYDFANYHLHSKFNQTCLECTGIFFEFIHLFTCKPWHNRHPSMGEDLSLKIEVHEQTIWNNAPESLLFCSIQMKSKSVGNFSQKSTRLRWPKTKIHRINKLTSLWL